MLYISPPFGNYVSYKNATRIEGTFTWFRRKGLIYQCLRSIRPTKGGWINQIGFRNKGIRSRLGEGPSQQSENMISICGMQSREWWELIEFIDPSIALELNLSCPNVHEVDITDNELSLFVMKFPKLQIKVVPTCVPDIERFVELGFKTIHLSNTLPGPTGGISGAQLKEVNLPLVYKAANRGLSVIAGGGIYSYKDVEDYRNAGADHFSIATVLFQSPWNIPKIYKHAMINMS